MMRCKLLGLYDKTVGDGLCISLALIKKTETTLSIYKSGNCFIGTGAESQAAGRW